MQLGAFVPQGKTALFAVTDVSTASPVQATPYQSLQPSQVLAYNAGTGDAFLSWAPTAAAAVAVFPTGTGTNAQTGVVIPAGAIMVVTTAPGVYYAAICASGQTASLYITPGEGV